MSKPWPDRIRSLYTASTSSIGKLLTILRQMEPVIIILAITGLALDYSTRTEERTGRAWQTLSMKAAGNSGKIEALQYLNRIGKLLEGIDLTPPEFTESTKPCSKRVYLVEIQLSAAKLRDANFSCANLRNSNLAKSDLSEAVLNEAILTGVNMKDADLQNVDALRTQFGGANFSGANLQYADFTYANLERVDFTNATINKLNVGHAVLYGAKGLSCAKLEEMDNWTQSCRDSVLECGRDIPDKADCEYVYQQVEVAPQSVQDVDKVALLRREMQFRVNQVDETFENANAMDAEMLMRHDCSGARVISVVAALGGLLRFPPPTEQETVWIGGSGYGYRHIPYKAGYRSEEFARSNLLEIAVDLGTIDSKYNPNTEELAGELDVFDARTKFNSNERQACAQEQIAKIRQWISDAKEAWSGVKKSLQYSVVLGN